MVLRLISTNKRPVKRSRIESYQLTVFSDRTAHKKVEIVAQAYGIYKCDYNPSFAFIAASSSSTEASPFEVYLSAKEEAALAF